jgi:uridine phosphorylase
MTPTPDGETPEPEVVDKQHSGRSGEQFHIGLSPGQLPTAALLPGDPFRVPLIAEQLDDVTELAHRREHRTMVGTYQGHRVAAVSTGMGCPSTAIAVEELIRCGVTSFIRVGSTAALQPGIEPGDLIVSHGTLRNDGTSDAYVPRGYPAVPDLEVTRSLERGAVELAERRGVGAHVGINATDDAFYAETPEWIAQLSRIGLTNVEMESSALFVVARLRGCRAAMICSVSSNLVAGQSLYDDSGERLAAGWRHSIEVALQTVAELGL